MQKSSDILPLMALNSEGWSQSSRTLVHLPSVIPYHKCLLCGRKGLVCMCACSAPFSVFTWKISVLSHLSFALSLYMWAPMQG